MKRFRNYSLLAALFSLALCAHAEWSAPLVRVARVEYHVPETSYTIDDYIGGYWAMWDRTGFTSTEWKNYGGAMNMFMQSGTRTSGINYVETGITSDSRYVYSGNASAVNALFRGDGFTFEGCFSSMNDIRNALVAQDWGIAENRVDGMAYCCFKIASCTDGLGIFVDREYVDRTSPNAVIQYSLFNTNTIYTVAVTRFGNDCAYYLNGEKLGTFSVGRRIGSSYVYIGNVDGDDIRHHVHRYYPRALTAAEVRRNWLVDRHRYGEDAE